MPSASLIRLVAASLVTLGGSLAAQGVGWSGQPLHAFVLTTGMTTMSVDALNARMMPSHFAALSDDPVSFGVGGYFALDGSPFLRIVSLGKR